jgi:uncharacterized protein with GYD domain
MIRVVSLVSLTDEGLQSLGRFEDTLAKIRSTITDNGGTLEHVWATAGKYDFVAIVSFPDLEAEFRSRNSVYKLGVIRAEHMPAMPMDQAIQLMD